MGQRAPRIPADSSVARSRETALGRAHVVQQDCRFGLITRRSQVRILPPLLEKAPLMRGFFFVGSPTCGEAGTNSSTNFMQPRGSAEFGSGWGEPLQARKEAFLGYFFDRSLRTFGLSPRRSRPDLRRVKFLIQAPIL